MRYGTTSCHSNHQLSHQMSPVILTVICHSNHDLSCQLSPVPLTIICHTNRHLSPQLSPQPSPVTPTCFSANIAFLFYHNDSLHVLHTILSQAVSSVIYYYTMLTSEAVSGGGFDSHFPWNWYCSVFGTAYHWEYGQFTECSTSCGIGKKYKRAVCKDNYSGGRVDDAKCDCHDPPPVVVVSCATKLCEPR